MSGGPAWSRPVSVAASSRWMVAKNVLAILQTEVVLCFGGADAAESGGAMGLGICFPPTYEEFVVFFLRYFFAFGDDTGWLDFLEAFWGI